MHLHILAIAPCHSCCLLHRYNRMNKPKWTPPKWLFGPAWGVMYAAQSYSGWRVLHQVPLRGQPSAAATAAQPPTSGMCILGGT
jgi:tryptophan-rich sensory protein